MIFYELTKLYESLVQKKKISPPGWMDEKISYGLLLGKDGDIKQLLSLKDEDGKPCRKPVPEHPVRSSGISPFFLWDNASYLLGLKSAGKSQKAMERFMASKTKHLEILEGVHTDAAEAVRRFFRSWEPHNAYSNEVIKAELEELSEGANLTFYYEGYPVSEDTGVKEKWEQYVNQKSDGKEGVCLVTGNREPIARLHPLIKGVWGAQPSGASLVSFNEDAFCSYGREGGYNAQTSERTVKAYSAALNYLLLDSERVFRAGDVTMVCWVEEGESAYPDLLMAMLNQDDSIHEADVRRALEKLCRGESIEWQEYKLRPDNVFYILGLSPNAARLSVRFFLESQFGEWVTHIQSHEKRLDIVRPSGVKKPYLPLWLILDEIRVPGAKEGISPLTASLLRSVLKDARYPKELLSCAVRRIRADHDLNWKRAAILKAYIRQNSMSDKNKEGCTVRLNTETDHPAYLLGRLFSLLENVQTTSAGGSLNTTVKDQYLNSMCSTPALVLAHLLKLKESHMKKLKRDKPGLAVRLEKQIVEIMGKLEVPIPRQLDLEEQAVFMLGYYHQTQKRYEGKEED